MRGRSSNTRRDATHTADLTWTLNQEKVRYVRLFLADLNLLLGWYDYALGFGPENTEKQT